MFISVCVGAPEPVCEHLGQVSEGQKSGKPLSGNRALSRQFWGRHLWARGYFAASSGNVTDEVIMQYIAMQDMTERARDDDFTISPRAAFRRLRVSSYRLQPIVVDFKIKISQGEFT